MKTLFAAAGIVGAIVVLAIAYALTASINLPTAADIGIWVVAGGYTFFYLAFAVIAILAARDW